MFQKARKIKASGFSGLTIKTKGSSSFRSFTSTLNSSLKSDLLSKMTHNLKGLSGYLTTVAVTYVRVREALN